MSEPVLTDARLVIRSGLRYEALREMVMVLCTYEMPIDRVRLLIDKVSDQMLAGFPDLQRAGPRAELATELLERFVKIEDAIAAKTESALIAQAKAQP